MDASPTSILSGTAGGDLTGTFPNPTVKSFRELEMIGEGILAETGPRFTAPAGSILVSQNVYVSRLAIKSGTTATNMVVGYSASGATLTTVTLALFDKTAQIMLAQTANAASSFTQTTATAANMRVAVSFTAAYAVTASDVYYAAIYCNGTTPPTMYRHTNPSIAGVQVGSGVRPTTFQVSVGTSMPSTITLADQATNQVPFWAAIT